MGCDIHLILEERRKGRWVMVREVGNAPAASRNYDRFAKLAGVRGAGPPPRGLPKNCNSSTRHFFTDRDFHSHSWGTAKEVLDIFRETLGERIMSETIPNLSPLVSSLTDLNLFVWLFDPGTLVEDGDINDYRIVYAFDN